MPLARKGDANNGRVSFLPKFEATGHEMKTKIQLNTNL
jgi:hypothetical protein